MITIDGATGYGQVLRTSIALSTLTLKPIRVVNIRKQRAKPGLMPQHLTGVRIAGEFCNAKIKGLKIGSTEIEFIPKSFDVRDREIDIGTAGSIPLLLQTLTPMLIFSDKPVTVEIIGGTFGLGSPTIEYVTRVTLPLLTKLGVRLPETEIIKQGGYPKGGGRIKIKFKPVKKLNSIQLTERGEVKSIRGLSIAGSLPKDVVERQTNSAVRVLHDYVDDIRILSQIVDTLSPGTSITLWAECENTILGSDNIGKRGVRAEVIGEDCAKELIKSIESGAALDKYMSDQILVFIALAHGKSKITAEEITEHVKTNISVIEQMLGVEFTVDRKNIEVDGIGFTEL